MKNLLEMTEILELVKRFSELKVVSKAETYIKVENSFLTWRFKFEKEIKRIIDENDLELTYSTSFGWYDYLITNKGVC